MSQDGNAKAASPEMMERWGMVSIRASELADLQAEVARLTAREKDLVEALESVTDRQKGIPLSHVFRHDMVIHGGVEHRDDERGRAACKVCAALAGSPPPGAPSHEVGPPAGRG